MTNLKEKHSYGSDQFDKQKFIDEAGEFKMLTGIGQKNMTIILPSLVTQVAVLYVIKRFKE